MFNKSIFLFIGFIQFNPTDSLVAYFLFNANANDSIGGGHDGTVCKATLTNDRFGNSYLALKFDGINKHINIISKRCTNNPYLSF